MVANKAIFLDRDGVLIKAPTVSRLPKSIKKLSEIKIYSEIKKFCKFYKKKYLLIMITNQPDYSKKINTKKNIDNINRYLKKKLGLDQIYVCYCKTDSCENRKPNPGMILQAAKKFNLQLSECFVIGDRWKDILAGNRAKCKTIFIDRNYNETLKFKPNYKVKTIKSIYSIIN